MSIFEAKNSTLPFEARGKPCVSESGGGDTWLPTACKPINKDLLKSAVTLQSAVTLP
eukprot:m.76681 g.76681  ORF g.76681 m.76681 type:complete len:57 (-) comp12495_c1_seq2:201-371(-)